MSQSNQELSPQASAALWLLLAALGVLMVGLTVALLSWIPKRTEFQVANPAGPEKPAQTPGADPKRADPTSPDRIEVIKVAKLAIDDPSAPFWDNAPSHTISMQPQQMAMPMLKTISVTDIAVQGASDGERIAFRVRWADPTPNWNVDTGRFCDGVALGFPLDPDAPAMMGAEGMRMQILYWKALWQKDIDHHYQDVQDLHPNFWSDLYWFAEGKFPYPIQESFKTPISRQWFPANRAGNPMSDFDRKQPVQELLAEGWGSLTHQTASATTGKGIYKDGHWEVVFSRPLHTDDPLDHQFDEKGAVGKAAFAVWDGAKANRGGRKQWTNWVTFELRKEARAQSPSLLITRVSDLGKPDPYAAYWADVPSTGVPVQPQQITAPQLKDRSITHVRAQAVHDGKQVAFRIVWTDPTADWNVDTGRFCDAVSMGLPIDAGAPPMMGAEKLRMQIIYWKALWQWDVDKGWQDVQDLHPNFWSDLYWFAEGKFPYPIETAFNNPVSRQWFPAHMAGNPMADFERKFPVQELVAEGWGSLTKQETSASRGRGDYRDGRWSVVFTRPLKTKDPLDYGFDVNKPGQVVFAVWNGAEANRGARKHWSNWVNFNFEVSPK